MDSTPADTPRKRRKRPPLEAERSDHLEHPQPVGVGLHHGDQAHAARDRLPHAPQVSA